MLAFLTFILKLVGIIGVSCVAYGLATTKIREGPLEYPLESTHPYLAVVLELGAIAIIFLA